jgi:3'-phosphoadenosine 5'-phosphosulfate sulfotransferase (PAPS reductase)/FAD synthetase
LEHWQLKQRQSLPWEVQAERTLLKIIQWRDYWAARGKDIAISYSGGMQSTVLKHIAERFFGNNILSIFSNTGNEHPENIKFIRTLKNVEWVRPEMTPEEVILTKGYPVISKKISRFAYDLQGDPTRNAPTRNLRLTGYNQQGKYCSSMKMPKTWLFLGEANFPISEECCNILKKHPLKQAQKKYDAVPIIGEMATEGRDREKRYLDYGCNAYDADEPISRPLGPWTQQGILSYIKENKVPYSAAYGDIVEDKNGKLTTTKEKRTGCMMCILGCHLEKCPNRFQRMKHNYPKMHNRFIGGGEFNKDGLWLPNKEGLGYGYVLDYINAHIPMKKWIKYWDYAETLEDYEQVSIGA